MGVVLLATAAGILFGALAVAVRAGLRRRPDAEVGALVVALVGCVLAVIVAAPVAAVEGVEPAGLWAFALVGAIVPGASQILFVRAIRDIGASRTAVLIGTAPVLSAGLAIAFLDEPFRGALAVATVAIVLGGVLLAWERERPPGFRLVGAALALAAAALFAVRDNVVRWASLESGVQPLLAAAVSLAAAALVLLVYLAAARREPLGPLVRPAAGAFVPAGVCLGLAYIALLLALDAGEVTVVAPLNATQSLWGVLLAAAFLPRAEAVGPRLVLAAVLVVVGGALVGATR
ncbi:MAG TPA: DMT family transporter [Gaiellaceae bacterium]|nr:DMT family transporter [Gaiellaceae bacterium]